VLDRFERVLEWLWGVVSRERCKSMIHEKHYGYVKCTRCIGHTGYHRGERGYRIVKWRDGGIGRIYRDMTHKERGW
jgi:hypothetical protein